MKDIHERTLTDLQIGDKNAYLFEQFLEEKFKPIKIKIEKEVDFGSPFWNYDLYFHDNKEVSFSYHPFSDKMDENDNYKLKIHTYINSVDGQGHYLSSTYLLNIVGDDLSDKQYQEEIDLGEYEEVELFVAIELVKHYLQLKGEKVKET